MDACPAVLLVVWPSSRSCSLLLPEAPPIHDASCGSQPCSFMGSPCTVVVVSASATTAAGLHAMMWTTTAPFCSAGSVRMLVAPYWFGIVTNALRSTVLKSGLLLPRRQRPVGDNKLGGHTIREFFSGVRRRSTNYPLLETQQALGHCSQDHQLVRHSFHTTFFQLSGRLH